MDAAHLIDDEDDVNDADGQQSEAAEKLFRIRIAHSEAAITATDPLRLPYASRTWC
jgi:hypothetical protein